MNPLLHPLAVESTLQTEHLVEPPTNRFGCVGGVHPKPLPTGYGSLMGFAWVGLLATQCSREKRVKIPGLDAQASTV